MKTTACWLTAMAILAIDGIALQTGRGASHFVERAAPVQADGEQSGFPEKMARGWHYSLLPGSLLIDTCPPCGRPDIPVTLRGSFRVRWAGGNPLFDEYAWEDIRWKTDLAWAPCYEITGRGTFRIGGEVALTQELFLDVWLNDGSSNRHCLFTNVAGAVGRPWPMIQIGAAQTNGLPFQQFLLDIVAAPFREIWFSTRNSFHAGMWNAPTNYVSPGDLLSSAGRVVRRNQELTDQLGVMPPVPDLGLDAVGILSRGELAFSIESEMFSERLGPLHSGDILSANGRILTSGASLAQLFGPEPPAVDEGLDALQFLSTGEFFFSVTNDFFSETLGRTIRRGDLLVSTGRVWKANEELVAAFHPFDPKKDYGLDAIYVWPWGEVWFSVETGFYGQHFDSYGAGDLLSDQGYVVYRNLDLMSPFQPLEDLADFGLDSLLVITDVEVAPAATGARFVSVSAANASAGLSLRAASSGRLQQIEKAPNVAGPWTPLVPIELASTNLSVLDPGALTNQPCSFYRMLTW